MRIRPYHFRIENFRNFRDTSFDLGRKITVISGQNGVGKSNMLSLIAFKHCYMPDLLSGRALVL